MTRQADKLIDQYLAESTSELSEMYDQKMMKQLDQNLKDWGLYTFLQNLASVISNYDWDDSDKKKAYSVLPAFKKMMDQTKGI